MLRRIHPLLFVIAVIVGVKLTEQLYRWVAFGEERASVRALRTEMAELGVEIVRLSGAKDSVEAVVRAEDRKLEAEHRALRRYNALAHDGALPHDLYVRYKRDLARYNQHVFARNARMRDWQEVSGRRARAERRYDVLADSLQQLAIRMGEPYFVAPTPLEAAAERGLIQHRTRP